MKAKLTFCVIALFIVFMPCFSMAQETQKIDPSENFAITPTPDSDLLKNEESVEPPKLLTNHAFEFGFMYHYFDYKEDIDPPGKSSEEGWLPGLYLGWSYNKKNAVYSKIFFEFSYGETEYDGTNQTGTIPITYSDDNRQFLFRGEWNIGYNFAITKNISLKPYVGYGYRYWLRGEYKKRSHGIPSVEERYYWHYLPAGVSAEFKIGDKFFIEPNAGIRWMFYGRMQAYMSEVYPGCNDPQFKLGNELGGYAEIPLRYKFSQYWSVVVKPWYEYSKIGKSDTVPITYYGMLWDYAYEPASRTHQYGLNVGLVVSY
jgi:hypothetical protein